MHGGSIFFSGGQHKENSRIFLQLLDHQAKFFFRQTSLGSGGWKRATESVRWGGGGEDGNEQNRPGFLFCSMEDDRRKALEGFLFDSRSFDGFFGGVLGGFGLL